MLDYTTPKQNIKLPPKQEKIVQQSVKNIQEAETSFIDDPIQSVSETEFNVDEVLKTLNDPPLILANYEVSEEMKNYVRELKGLDKAMQTQRGELTNNLAKLSQLDKDIAKEKRKLTETNDPEMIDRINRRLRDYELERDARLESVSTNRQNLRSQISRIKETIYRILNEDETLGDKLRTLFREQGITIASILTAISMIISTIVLAVTGSAGGVAPTPDTPIKPKDPGFIKKTLDRIAQGLKFLAQKALASLPGVIGAIISWLFNFLSKTVGFIAENTWTIFVAVGGLILYAVKSYIDKQ